MTLGNRKNANEIFNVYSVTVFTSNIFYLIIVSTLGFIKPIRFRIRLSA